MAGQEWISRSETRDVLVRVAKPLDYMERYREYLARSNEKEVLAQAIRPLIKPGSVLDVGAGGGELAHLLAIDVSEYTAVECHPHGIESLRQKGYRVIPKVFPCLLDGKFDNVLMSYCLYGGKAQCTAIVDAALAATAHQGRVIAVTFRDGLDDYNRLLHRVGHINRSGVDVYYNFIREILAARGGVTSTVVTSHIFVRNLETLCETIAFMATNSNIGTLEWRHELVRRLTMQESYLERYRHSGVGYKFPIAHHIFAVDIKDNPVW